MSLYLFNKIEILHNRCLRFIYRLSRFDHISQYKMKSLLLTPYQRRPYYLGNLIFKIFKFSKPDYLQSLFPRYGDEIRHTNRITAPSSKFIIPRHQSNYILNSFSATTIRMWNNFPPYLRTATSLNNFKNLNYIYINSKYKRK